MRLLSIRSCNLVFYVFLVFKFFFGAYLYFSHSYLGGGSDANSYHQYALGLNDSVVNSWPVLLRWLYDLGLYNRVGVTLALFVVANLYIPFVFSKIVVFFTTRVDERRFLFWNSLVFLSFYPTIFYYSLDVYRDVLMFASFLTAVYALLSLYYGKSLVVRLVALIIFLFLSFICYSLRNYLGFSMVLSLIVSAFVNFKKRFWFLGVGYLIGIVFVYQLGLIDRIVEYRGVEFSPGGTTIGISMLNKNGFEFLYLFVYSLLVQLFGFYLFKIQGVLAFFSESLFFIVLFVYVVKNKKIINVYMNYLICFFLTYSSIWIIGNDNLGTAVRLRVFSYLSIYLVAISVFIIKRSKYYDESR